MATLKNRNDLQAEAAANLPDNTTQAISPQDVRQMAENLAESNFNKITDGPLVGLKPYNTGVIYETGQGANYLGNLYFANKTTTLGAFVAADWDLFASNVSDLNDLSDVATGLPGTPTIVDDTKLLFYDHGTSKFITDDIITAGTVVINAKKASAGTIAKGKPVYLVGFDSDLHTVEEANAGAVGTMPVIGFAAENMDATNAKKITTFGKLTGLDTSAFSLGADLYISTTTGTLTATRPTGAGSFIQRVAKVLKSAASGGQLFIFNTARAAGLPNLAQNNLWVGDANGQPQAVNKSTITPTDAQIEIGYNNQVPEVTQAEAEAGTVTTVKRWTPQRVKQAIDALASGGNTIYSADDSLTGDRTVTLATNDLTFDCGTTGLFVIDGSNTTENQVFTFQHNGSTSFLLTKEGRIQNTNVVGNNVLEITNASKDSGIILNNSLASIYSAQLLIRHSLSDSNGIRIVTGTNFEEIKWQQGSSADFNHQIKSGSVSGSNEVRFFNKGWTNSDGFIIGGSSVVGSEDISLQGETTIQGAGTTTGTTLALYDNDTTPSKTWEWLDNGSATGNGLLKIDNTGGVSGVEHTGLVLESQGTVGSQLSLDFKQGSFRIASVKSTVNGTSDNSLILGTNQQIELLHLRKTNVGINESNPQAKLHVNGDSLFNDILTIDNSNGVQDADLTQLRLRTGGFFGGGTAIEFMHAFNNSYVNAKIRSVTNGSSDGSLILGTNQQIELLHLRKTNVGINESNPQAKLHVNGTLRVDDTLNMNNNRILNAVINPSVQEAANSATFTINADQQSDGVLTAMAAATTIAAPTGTPVQCQDLVFRFKDDGTARALTWNAVFRAIGVTLPTTTTASKLLYVGCKYNSTDSKWDVIAVQEEA